MKTKKYFLLFVQSKGAAGKLKDGECIKKFPVIPPLK